MVNTQTVNVKIGKDAYTLEYDITNWSKSVEELVSVFGAIQDIVDDYQLMKAWHSTHGVVRRRCVDLVYAEARKLSPAKMERVLVEGEKGAKVEVERETAESLAAWDKAAVKIAKTVLSSMQRIQLAFTKGSREPGKGDFALAQAVLESFVKDATAYTALRKKAKTLYAFDLPAAPTVEALAGYQRAKKLAESDNPMSKF